MLGKKKILAAFLEKDDLKLLVYEVFLGKINRVFAGQISFSPEVLRDAFISDSVKFSNQVKAALGQKLALREATEVVLFIPPDKTFTKSQPAADSVDAFVQSLPYFREELVISEEQVGGKQLEEKVTYVAFEKKLVEDLEAPFLEMGKKVVAVKSSVNVLSLASGRLVFGDYFLFISFEKEVAVVAVTGGGISAIASFSRQLFAARLVEFVANHNLSSIKQAYTLGPFEPGWGQNFRNQEITVSALLPGDIYDLALSSYLGEKGKAISIPLPSQRYWFLVGAVVVGAALVFLLVKGAGKAALVKDRISGQIKSPLGSNLPAGGGTTAPSSPSAQVAAEPKPGEFKVRVLNGTLIEGEAGKLADKLKGLGFDVVEAKNATSAGFIASRLRTAADVPDKIVATVKVVLTDTYESVSLEPLASDSAGVRIEIIIGKKK